MWKITKIIQKKIGVMEILILEKQFLGFDKNKKQLVLLDTS